MTYVTDKHMTALRQGFLEHTSEFLDRFSRKDTMTFLLLSTFAFDLACRARFATQTDARVEIREFVEATRHSHADIEQYLTTDTCIDLLEASALREAAVPDLSDTSRTAAVNALLKALLHEMEPEDVNAIFELARQAAEDSIKSIATTSPEYARQVGIL